jgi:hypothetical protein
MAMALSCLEPVKMKDLVMTTTSSGDWILLLGLNTCTPKAMPQTDTGCL